MKARNDIWRSSIIIQVIFWSISFFVLFRIFTKDYNNGVVDFIYTLLFHIPLFIVVFINYRMINKWIRNQKYYYYIFGSMFLIFLGIFIHFIVFNYLSTLLFPGYYFISMFSMFEIAQYLLTYIIISLLIQLSKNWFDLQEKQKLLEKENQQVQLKSLKAQLNPHFLFNSLNNIYSISNISDSRAKDYIIKLSDALRYMLYRTQDEKVLLSEELEYIQNYIELEKLRLEGDSELVLKISNQTDHNYIAPLILLPIIENTFKHCRKDPVKINISISVDMNTLILNCQNTVDYENIQLENKGGIGLSNVKERLELIYPNNYILSIKEEDCYYKTILQINL